jgi:alkaline phosphatase D
MHRRQFLKGAVTAAAGTLWACEASDGVDGVDTADTGGRGVSEPARNGRPEAAWPGEVAVDAAAFPLGAQVGDPLPGSAVFWAWTAPGVSVRLVVVRWDGAAWVAQTTVETSADDAGFVHVTVEGLVADTALGFQFVDPAGAGSEVGHARTAPDPAAEGVVSVGFTSCLQQRHEVFPSLQATQIDGPLDAFLFLGDTGYFDDLVGIDAYRALWQRQLAAPGIRDVLRSAAAIYTWDDHEFQNNLDPVADVDALAWGRQAFFEATPSRRDDEDPNRRWRALRLGAAVEIFVLDCRTERRADEGRYLSEAQLAWFLEAVAASTATWKLVMNSVPIARLDGSIWDVPLAEEDRWEGFPVQRQQVIDALSQVPGVVFLSGDIHCPALAKLEPDGPGSTLWDLIGGPGGSSPNPGAVVLAQQANVVWSAQTYNAVRLDASARGTLRARWYDEEGNVRCDATLDVDGVLRSIETFEPA